jgi:hypothetical protein
MFELVRNAEQPLLSVQTEMPPAPAVPKMLPTAIVPVAALADAASAGWPLLSVIVPAVPAHRPGL